MADDDWDETPVQTEAPEPSYNRGRGGGRGGGERRPPREARDGDWTCPDDSCGTSNFASRRECHKCQTENPNPSSGGGRPPREPQPGDWPCPENGCDANNFSSKRNCFKCGADRPEGAGGGGRPPREARDDDWICPDEGCGVSNYANRRQCFKCQTDNPNQSSGGERRPPREPRADDWTCVAEGCGVSNYANRRECFKCQTENPNPSPAGEDGDKKPTERYEPQALPEGDTLFDERNKEFGTGINFDSYDKIPIQASENMKTVPASTFQEMNLRPLVLKNIAKLKYTKPTPIQKYGSPVLANKQDLMACAQTGSGKTGAFLIPIVNELMQDPNTDGSGRTPAAPEALIVAPTRELVIQIHREASMYADSSILRVRNLYGGTTINHQKSQIFAGCNILVATPGRLKQFISEGHLSLANVRYFILDEADRMLDMGFMGDVHEIVKTLPEKGTRVTGMFSATFPPEIQQSAAEFMNDYVFLVLGMVGGACQDVQQSFIQVEKGEKKDKIMILLRDLSADDKVVIFCNTKKTADFLASRLSMEKISSTSIHGDRLQSQREAAIREFTHGIRKVLVATAVAARGLDIPKVSMVINYDMPKEVDEYVHRIGRTGRVGHIGKAITLYEDQYDSEMAAKLIPILKQANQPIPEFLEGMGGGDDGVFNASDARNGPVAPPPASNDDDWD